MVLMLEPEDARTMAFETNHMLLEPLSTVIVSVLLLYIYIFYFNHACDILIMQQQ